MGKTYRMAYIFEGQLEDQQLILEPEPGFMKITVKGEMGIQQTITITKAQWEETKYNIHVPYSPAEEQLSEEAA